MNGKRKLISRFGWDCFWLSLIFAVITVTSLPQLFLLLNIYALSRNKDLHKEVKFTWRKPSLIELAEIFIFISAITVVILIIQVVNVYNGQLMKQPAFLISSWVLTLSCAFYRLAKDLAALKNPTPAPN